MQMQSALQEHYAILLFKDDATRTSNAHCKRTVVQLQSKDTCVCLLNLPLTQWETTKHCHRVLSPRATPPQWDNTPLSKRIEHSNRQVCGSNPYF